MMVVAAGRKHWLWIEFTAAGPGDVRITLSRRRRDGLPCDVNRVERGSHACPHMLIPLPRNKLRREGASAVKGPLTLLAMCRSRSHFDPRQSQRGRLHSES